VLLSKHDKIHEIARKVKEYFVGIKALITRMGQEEHGNKPRLDLGFTATRKSKYELDEIHHYLRRHHRSYGRRIYISHGTIQVRDSAPVDATRTGHQRQVEEEQLGLLWH
jgi:hypothetical protein